MENVIWASFGFIMRCTRADGEHGLNTHLKYENIFPNRHFRDLVPSSAWFKWKVGDWFNQTNDLYQPIVIISLS